MSRRPAEAATRVPADSRPGYGIIGLRERASTLGGSIDAGPRAGGGFGVRATLPIVDAYEPEQR